MAAVERKGNAGAHARAEMRDERRERAREDGAANWGATQRTDWRTSGHESAVGRKILGGEKQTTLWKESTFDCR
jgi:hypothetical protein